MVNSLSKVKSSVLFVSVLFFATNCTTEDPVEEVEKDAVCGISDPVNNLKWLNDKFKALIGGPETNGIVLYQYNDNQVIEIQSSVFNSTNIHQYSCDGVKLNLEDPQAFKDFQNKKKEIKILFGTKIWQ